METCDMPPAEHLSFTIPGVVTGEADGFAAIVVLAVVVLAALVMLRIPASWRDR